MQRSLEAPIHRYSDDTVVPSREPLPRRRDGLKARGDELQAMTWDIGPQSGCQG
jgi:hypothetical protein